MACGAVLAFAAGMASSLNASREEQPAVDRAHIAVLRRDGLIIPFAAVQGTRWRAEWPQNIRLLELPVNVASIPERWWGGEEPGTWQAWLTGGGTRDITLVEPQIFPIHCAPRIGIRTDYKPAEPPPRLQVEPFPKDGIAVAGGARVEPLAEVGADTPEWRALAVALLEQFNRAEDREIAVIERVFDHPVERDNRHRLPLRLETWFRTTLADGTTVSYVEAARSYPPGPEDEGCGLETLVGGWVTHEKGEPRPGIELGARITYCDRVGATFMHPFGRLRIRDRVYWIAQLAGGEAEWYTVTQIAPGRIRNVAEYLAGTRDSCVS